MQALHRKRLCYWVAFALLGVVQTLHAFLQEDSMYAGFFSHSPLAAQSPQDPSASTQSPLHH